VSWEKGSDSTAAHTFVQVQETPDEILLEKIQSNGDIIEKLELELELEKQQQLECD
jgi:hypothetical protein